MIGEATNTSGCSGSMLPPQGTHPRVWELLLLGCDVIRCVCFPCLSIQKKLINDSFLPDDPLCPTNTHTHTNTRTHIIQRIPTHTLMTPWTGATRSLRVWLLFSPAEMDVAVPHRAGLISGLISHIPGSCVGTFYSTCEGNKSHYLYFLNTDISSFMSSS